jgi:hypothetical protein
MDMDVPRVRERIDAFRQILSELRQSRSLDALSKGAELREELAEFLTQLDNYLLVRPSAGESDFFELSAMSEELMALLKQASRVE